MLHHKQTIRFNCTACGQCCYGDKNAYIKLNLRDAQNIAKHINVTYSHFRRYYLTRLVDNSYGIRIKETGACALLGTDGKCRAYAVRPMQCRTYPYWPEILVNKSAWKNEKLKCEGIDVGDIVDNDYIEKQLALSIAAENEIY